jgi:hypothetical protein
MKERKLVTQSEGAANHRREQSRDLLEIVLSILQKRQGPVRDQVSRRTRQSSGVSDARMHCSVPYCICMMRNANSETHLLLGWISRMMALKYKDTSQS